MFRFALLAAAVSFSSISSAAALDSTLRCRLGDYQLSDGRVLTVTGYEGGSNDLRYVLSSGEYGRMASTRSGAYRLGNDPFYGSVDFSGCGKGLTTFYAAENPGVRGTKLHLNSVDTYFISQGTRLFGKLVLPASGKVHSIVVWIQGSDDDPATDDEFWQYVLPLRGVGVFVYDKRGSGRSGGELSADFYLRADDTAAAVLAARRLAPEVRRIGVFGGSQGGWIAPLTATKTKLDFVVVGYSLVEGVVAQDRYEVEDQLREAGYGDDVIRKSREITAATARIVRSHWTRGWKYFLAVQKKYSHEPWVGAIKETGFTGIMLRTPIAQIQVMGPKLDKHVSFNYDPAPVVATIVPAQLWILGGSDHTTPSTRTVAILRNIQKRNRNLDLVIYRSADHGIVETFTTNGIVRHRFPNEYFDAIARWVRTGELPRPDADLELWPGAAHRHN